MTDGQGEFPPGEGSDDHLSEHELARHISVIRRYLSRFLRSDELEDATQTVLQRALERRATFRGDSSLRGWLLGIARFVGLETARARQRAPKLTAEGAFRTGDLVVPIENSQEELLGRKEQHALLMRALDGLSIEEKLALLMTYVDGVPGPEAAENLDVSFPAFRQRLSRARQALHKRFKALQDAGEPGSANVLAQWQVLLGPTPTPASPSAGKTDPDSASAPREAESSDDALAPDEPDD